MTPLASSAMLILELPTDIIALFPHYFISVYDLCNVLLTCKTLCRAYKDKNIKLPPILPKPDGQFLFQPHPHFLLTCLARQLGDWAVASASNRYELYQNLLGGYNGLLFLAERVTRVSLSDMRQLHGTKYSLLNPLTRLVDFEVGPAMVRNQEMDPETYGLTICQMPDVAVMNFVVYCDLFHHYVDNILSSPGDPELPRPLESGIRQRFIAYCLPDHNNHRNPHYQSLGGRGHDDEWQLLDYIEVEHSDAVNRRDEALKRYWHTGVLQEIPKDEHVEMYGHEAGWQPTIAEKREYLFLTVASHLGWDSLRMLMLDGFASPELQSKLSQIRETIQNISDDNVTQWEFWSFINDEADEDMSSDAIQSQLAWSQWLGLANDCHEGISTNQRSDEDLHIEEEACDHLLQLAVSAEEKGIIGPTPTVLDVIPDNFGLAAT
jgi:hypothetical protein